MTTAQPTLLPPLGAHRIGVMAASTTTVSQARKNGGHSMTMSGERVPSSPLQDAMPVRVGPVLRQAVATAGCGTTIAIGYGPKAVHGRPQLAPKSAASTPHAGSPYSTKSITMIHDVSMTML